MAVPFILGKTHLIIRPQTAQLTRDTETFGKMDPQCEFRVGNMVYKSSIAKDQGRTPQWTDSLTHLVQGTENELHLIVNEIDSVSSSDIIGEVKINLNETIQKGATSNWYELFHQGKSSGKILVYLQIANQ